LKDKMLKFFNDYKKVVCSVLALAEEEPFKSNVTQKSLDEAIEGELMLNSFIEFTKSLRTKKEG